MIQMHRRDTYPETFLFILPKLYFAKRERTELQARRRHSAALSSKSSSEAIITRDDYNESS